MFTGKRILVAGLAMAMVLSGGRSFAGEDGADTADYNAETADHDKVEQASFSTAGKSSSAREPHRVTIWRGGTPSLASTALQDDAEEPPIPPNAPNGFLPSDLTPSHDPGTQLLEEVVGTCDIGACESCNCGQESCPTCCGGCQPPWWSHRTFFYGQYLYLQPSGVNVAYAVQQVGPGGPGTTPAGRVGVVDQNFTSAYSAGFGVALSSCASIQANYVNFHSHDVDSLAAPNLNGGSVRSLVLHPESANAASTSSFVNAANDIDYQMADVEYRRLLSAGERFSLNYSLGGRWAQLDQSFVQTGTFSPPTAALRTSANINFEGGGLKAGLDGMQRLGNTRFGVYSKGFLSLIFGRFDTQYTQFDQTNVTTQATSNWSDERVVPILEYEVGINFTSRNGRWRSSTGYYTAFWFNTVSTPQYVQAVQNSNFVNLGETISFDGLVSRLEYRF